MNYELSIINYELWIMNYELGRWGNGGDGVMGEWGSGEEGRREKKADGWQKVLSGGYIY